MNSRLVALILTCLLLPLAVQAKEAAKTEADLVARDVQTVFDSFLKGDYAALISRMYPPVVAQGGGKEAVIAITKEYMESPEGRSVKFLKYTVEKPIQFLKGKEGRYAIIPLHALMEINGQRVLSKGFQLGIQDKKTKTWSYLDGAKLTTEQVVALIPDFPADAKLPKVTFEPVKPAATE